LEKLAIRGVELAIRDQRADGFQAQAGVAQHLSQTIVKLAPQLFTLMQHRQRPLLLEELRLGFLLIGHILQQEQAAGFLPAPVVQP
jgi:hypothetical protein